MYTVYNFKKTFNYEKYNRERSQLAHIMYYKIYNCINDTIMNYIANNNDFPGLTVLEVAAYGDPPYPRSHPPSFAEKII